MEELTPLSAVTAAHPYEYYARLAVERRFAFDERLRTWVAASAASVEAAFSNPSLHVRPPNEPVPAIAAGTPLGDVFARLARTTDGAAHRRQRLAASGLVERWGQRDVEACAQRCATRLAYDRTWNAESLTAYLYELPAATMAAWFGMEPAHDVLSLAGTFAAALRTAASPEEIRAAVPAAARLRTLVSPLLDDDAAANALGLFAQAYDATAALAGGVVASLIAELDLRHAALGKPGALDAHIELQARYDPPVHSTRRFAARATTIDGTRVRTGDCVLLSIAAANHDPSATRSYTFGFGPHACIGERIATAIVKAGIRALFESGFEPDAFATDGFRPSVVVRFPRFAARPHFASIAKTARVSR